MKLLLVKNLQRWSAPFFLWLAVLSVLTSNWVVLLTLLSDCLATLSTLMLVQMKVMTSSSDPPLPGRCRYSPGSPSPPQTQLGPLRPFLVCPDWGCRSPTDSKMNSTHI